MTLPAAKSGHEERSPAPWPEMVADKGLRMLFSDDMLSRDLTRPGTAIPISCGNMLLRQKLRRLLCPGIAVGDGVAAALEAGIFGLVFCFMDG